WNSRELCVRVAVCSGEIAARRSDIRIDFVVEYSRLVKVPIVSEAAQVRDVWQRLTIRVFELARQFGLGVGDAVVRLDLVHLEDFEAESRLAGVTRSDRARQVQRQRN